MAEISTERCTEALVLHLIIDYMMIFFCNHNYNIHL